MKAEIDPSLLAWVSDLWSRQKVRRARVAGGRARDARDCARVRSWQRALEDLPASSSHGCHAAEDPTNRIAPKDSSVISVSAQNSELATSFRVDRWNCADADPRGTRRKLIQFTGFPRCTAACEGNQDRLITSLVDASPDVGHCWRREEFGRGLSHQLAAKRTLGKKLPVKTDLTKVAVRHGRYLQYALVPGGAAETPPLCHWSRTSGHLPGSSLDRRRRASRTKAAAA
jgi:hypothetical protein